jgi:hypothetical protein
LAGFTRFPWAELEAGDTTVALIGTAGAPLAEVDLASPWPEHRWRPRSRRIWSRRVAPRDSTAARRIGAQFQTDADRLVELPATGRAGAWRP